MKYLKVMTSANAMKVLGKTYKICNIIPHWRMTTNLTYVHHIFHLICINLIA